jgi:hypothetical protein
LIALRLFAEEKDIMHYAKFTIITTLAKTSSKERRWSDSAMRSIA